MNPDQPRCKAGTPGRRNRCGAGDSPVPSTGSDPRISFTYRNEVSMRTPTSTPTSPATRAPVRRRLALGLNPRRRLVLVDPVHTAALHLGRPGRLGPPDAEHAEHAEHEGRHPAHRRPAERAVLLHRQRERQEDRGLSLLRRQAGEHHDRAAVRIRRHGSALPGGRLPAVRRQPVLHRGRTAHRDGALAELKPTTARPGVPAAPPEVGLARRRPRSRPRPPGPGLSCRCSPR